MYFQVLSEDSVQIIRQFFQVIIINYYLKYQLSPFIPKIALSPNMVLINSQT